ncbi:MAG TPA: type IV toxin-antitoxin system AbiEi family antitoxin [Thermoplasmata archaeon]|nr:type IV toxin-antitoxin system AbiEi family antitoxin [Thermoplasmata archaeon]
MKPRSLSATEARVVLSLEEEGAEELSLDAIQRLARVRRGFARKLAHGLVTKGWLQRVGRGRYLLNPSAYGPEAVPETDPLRVGSRLVAPYYFGFATAAELWGFLLQPGRTYYVVTPTRTEVRVRGPSHFRLVRVAGRRFFGSTSLERRGQALRVSDPERTVVDCIDRPELCGGMPGAVQVLARAKPRLSWPRLNSYLERLGNRSLAVRCGYLADHLRPSVPVPDRWRRRLLPKAADPWVPLGPPATYGRRGKREPGWRIICNVPEAELFAEADAR